MLNKTIVRAAAAVSVASLLASCATEGAGGTGVHRTAMDTAIQQCVITVGAGAILGALVNRKNRGTGAAEGAVVGGALCAVLLAMANEKDKQQLAEAERQAAITGRAQTVRYVGDDNKPRLIRVSAPVDVATSTGIPAGYGPCRTSETHVSITGVGDTTAPKQVICRNPEGDYVPV